MRKEDNKPTQLSDTTGTAIPEGLYYALLQNTNDIIVATGRDQRVLFRSPAASRITGWTNEEIARPGFFSTFVHPQDADSFQQKIQEALNHPGEQFSMVFRGQFKNGYYQYLEARMLNMLHVEKIQALIFIIKNITELRAKEVEIKYNREALDEQEDMLNQFINNSPAAIAMLNTDLCFVAVSRRWITDNHMEDTPVIGRHYFTVFPETTEDWKEIYKSCLEGGAELKREYLFIRENGNRQWLKWNIIPWTKSDGATGGIMLQTEDITESKETLLSMARSEEHFRDLLARISDGFFSLDEGWNFIYLNKFAEQIINIPASELIGKNYWQLKTSTPDNPFSKAYQRAMNTQQIVRIQEFAPSMGKWFSVVVYPSLSGMSIFFRDITREKELEILQKRSAEQYQELVERISDAFVAFDENYCFTYINRKAATILPVPPRDLIGKNVWEALPIMKEWKSFEMFHKAMETQHPVVFSDYFEPLKLWHETTIYPSPKGLSVFIRDITDLKLAEQHVRETNAMSDLIMDSALDAIICTGADERITVWNSQAEKLFGWAAIEILGQRLSATIIPERYRDAHRKGMDRYKQSMKSKILNQLHELTAIDKSGNEFPVEIFIVSLPPHQDYKFCAFIRDISQRKKAESEIRRSNRSLTMAQETAHIGVAEIELSDRKGVWSPEALRIYGFPENKPHLSIDEWFGRIHPDDKPHVQRIIRSNFYKKKTDSFEYRIIRPDGAIRNILTFVRLEEDERAGSPYFLAVALDITEIKKLEEELRIQQVLEQQNIAAATFMAEERERQAIGSELHDNVNQILVSAKLMLSSAKEFSDKSNIPLQLAFRHIESAIAENRKIAHEMVAPDFNEIELSHKLTELAQTMFTPMSISQCVNTEGFIESSLSALHKLTIYRIAQEQCTNIIKYAKADEVQIHLESHPTEFHMSITDNGAGAKMDEKNKGIGLDNIKTRLSVFSGRMHVTTAPGKGFKLEVWMPA